MASHRKPGGSIEYDWVARNFIHDFCGPCRILPVCLTLAWLTRGFPTTPVNSRYLRTGSGKLVSISAVMIVAGDIFNSYSSTVPAPTQTRQPPRLGRLPHTGSGATL